MKKSSIALLSSPALLAAFLLSSYPAQANTYSSSLTQDVDSSSSSIVITRTAQSADTNDQASNDRANILMSDRVGDLAIQKFGCDCMGCRQAALSLLSK